MRMKNDQTPGPSSWRLFRKNSPFWLYASPFAVIGAAAILAAVVVVMAIFNFNREKEYVTRILSEKGAAIIRALEAGTRTGMMGGLGRGPGLKRLLSETAGQEAIFEIALTDRSGRILAHGDSSLVGGQFLPPEELALLAPGAEEKWRVVREEETGRRSFLVYREFLPKGGVIGRGRERGGGVRISSPVPAALPGRGRRSTAASGRLSAGFRAGRPRAGTSCASTTAIRSAPRPCATRS
jgi:two-component system sensor histidine kinase HydH